MENFIAARIANTTFATTIKSILIRINTKTVNMSGNISGKSLASDVDFDSAPFLVRASIAVKRDSLTTRIFIAAQIANITSSTATQNLDTQVNMKIVITPTKELLINNLPVYVVVSDLPDPLPYHL